MLRLYYSPHSTSIDNESGVASGHADPPLSDEGRRRAADLGEAYAGKHVDAVFSSDLDRALSTSQIAFGLRDVPIVSDDRLREYDYGSLTRCPVSEVEEEFIRRVTTPFPGGESLVMVTERVGRFLSQVLERQRNRTVVVIGHRATKYALEYWAGSASLEEIVTAVWEWRDVPIWSYEIHPEMLGRALPVDPFRHPVNFRPKGHSPSR